MTDSKKNVKSKKIRRWFEPIGLFLLLAAFGWQCLDEQSQQMKIEGYLYETNEKLLAIWEGVYDEALHSERYNGKATVVVNYDAVNDYLLEQASQKYDGGSKRYDVRKCKSSFSHQTSDLSHPSSIKHHPSRRPSALRHQTS